eukprot:Hpha_TRINITY_DN2556_c0_g1::TRINITY_DN2556_c0_g1_i3::g.1421::m.1421
MCEPKVFGEVSGSEGGAVAEEMPRPPPDYDVVTGFGHHRLSLPVGIFQGTHNGVSITPWNLTELKLLFCYIAGSSLHPSLSILDPFGTFFGWLLQKSTE